MANVPSLLEQLPDVETERGMIVSRNLLSIILPEHTETFARHVHPVMQAIIKASATDLRLQDRTVVPDVTTFGLVRFNTLTYNGKPAACFTTHIDERFAYRFGDEVPIALDNFHRNIISDTNRKLQSLPTPHYRLQPIN